MGMRNGPRAFRPSVTKVVRTPQSEPRRSGRGKHRAAGILTQGDRPSQLRDSAGLAPDFPRYLWWLVSTRTAVESRAGCPAAGYGTPNGLAVAAVDRAGPIHPKSIVQIEDISTGVDRHPGSQGATLAGLGPLSIGNRHPLTPIVGLVGQVH